jgi:hypothetical protein
VILTEASLSFLGLGVPPPYPPWLAIWPAVALRDLLDPRLKGG